ncbi:MAG: hypothetical protein LBU89_00825 [Fibromonadaceae bacterium]|jgi:hypothetical protein|nr:hypothetical protein [Fibromonadaceae bacterium]
MENKKTQTMEEALSNVPDKLRAWISGVWKTIAKGKKINPKFQYQQNLGKISRKTKDAIQNFYGKNISKQIIKPESLRHIYSRHGKYPETEIKNGQIPMTASIAAIIPDVMANPDSVRIGGKTKKCKHETVILSKEYADGSLHIVNAILKNNLLMVHTAYVWNREKTEKRRMAYGSQKTGSNSAIQPNEGSHPSERV